MNILTKLICFPKKAPTKDHLAEKSNINMAIKGGVLIRQQFSKPGYCFFAQNKPKLARRLWPTEVQVRAKVDGSRACDVKPSDLKFITELNKF
jgi:hypothetical protein